MRLPYELKPLSPDEANRWDALISPYKTRELFHSKVWLDYLAASRGVKIRLWEVIQGGHTVGYLCGGIVQKGPFRVLGSPLKGWGTNSMGPVLNGYLDTPKLLRAFDDLARDEHLAMIELEHRLCCETAMAEANYEPVPSWNYLVTLTPENHDSMWRALESRCRTKIRKAESAGLSVEDTDDPVVAEEFYDQYTDLMFHKDKVPPYPREYPRLLFQSLKRADLLFALRVRDKNGRTLATGLFPHDDHAVYGWGSASWQDGRELCPNEYLHWQLMRLAASRGIRCYNMANYSRFYKKFGGVLFTFNRWHKCFSRPARWARRSYEFYFEKRLQIQSWWRQVSHSI